MSFSEKFCRKTPLKNNTTGGGYDAEIHKVASIPHKHATDITGKYDKAYDEYTNKHGYIDPDEFDKMQQSTAPTKMSPLNSAYEQAVDTAGGATYVPTASMYQNMFNAIGLAAHNISDWMKRNPGKHASGFDKDTHDFLGRERTGKKGTYVRKGDKKRYEKLAAQDGWTEDSGVSAEEYFFKNKGFEGIEDPLEREEKLREQAHLANKATEKEEGFTLERDDHGFLTGGGEYMVTKADGSTAKTDKSQLTSDDPYHADLETYEEFKQRTGIKTT